MGIYIKDMEMPAGNWACPLFSEYGDCAAVKTGDNDCSEAEKDKRGFPHWCPLVHVPPHGRLGDLDALCESKDILDDVGWPDAYLPLSTIEAAPTIIPAEPLNEEVNE